MLAAMVAVLGIADGGRGAILTAGTAFSALQQFATVGPVALALGLSMLIREFDLSVGGMLTLAGCIAVLTGVDHPLVGLASATLAGGAVGAVQGLIMVRLRLGSIGVTLGGLLTLSGLSYVLTGDATVGYPRMDVAMLVNAPVFGVLTLRNGAALAMFGVAALVVAATRTGRDVIACGSDKRAARVAGVNVGAIVIGVFAVSGVLTGAAGALLSYSLATASPAGLSDALVPAVAAAIIGGVSLTGGKGTPLGIAGGVLVICLLNAGLSAAGTPPYMQQVVTGLVLLGVALSDADDLQRRLFALRRLRPPAG